MSQSKKPRRASWRKWHWSLKEEWAVIMENKSFFSSKTELGTQDGKHQGEKKQPGFPTSWTRGSQASMLLLRLSPLHPPPLPTQNTFPGQRHHKPLACPCLSKSQRTTVGRELPALPDPCKSQGPSVFLPVLSLHLGIMEPRVR